MRSGLSCIGLHRPKDLANVGGAIRAAHAYGASMVAISGERINGDQITHGTNTSAAQNLLPVMRGDLRGLIPFSCVPVAVDLVDGAVPLMDFYHPFNAFYVFGPEDGTLGESILSWCVHRVMVPTKICMNLAATVNVVLYDRMLKVQQGRILR